MLTNIRLRNFKAFRDTGDVPIAPLTVLTGPNSSGKSTIIRAMMALRQTIEGRDQSTAFVPTGEYVDLGTFEDFAFIRDKRSSVGIDIELKLSSKYGTFLGIEMPPSVEQGELAVSLELAYLESIDRIYLTRSTVDWGHGEIRMHKETMGGRQLGRSYRTTVEHSEDVKANLAKSSIAKFHIVPPFQMKPQALSANGKKARQRMSLSDSGKIVGTQLAKMAEESVSRELASFQYIGPLRDRPRRMYLSTGETPREVGAAGELGPAVLWSASEAKQLDANRLSEWCSRMGLAFKVKLARVPGGYFRILIVDMHTGVEVNLPDVGVGTSQLLPILIQGIIAPAGTTFLLEQPEIHLHPKVQADLADFLVDVTKREVGVIVETHSEHLINRLQRRIAEESLNPDAVALYYVTPSAEGAKIEPVPINEYGQIPTAPDGFFEDGFEETFATLSAVGQRKAREVRA